MKKKPRIGILFGGRSGEHEVSLLSAASILKAIDKRKYDVVPIGIAKSGHWLRDTAATALLAGQSATLSLTASASASSDLTLAQATPAAMGVDVVFPVLHGTFGEDGTIQGLFELADIAYVGSGVLGSAVGMDKDVMKKLFSAAQLPQTKHVTLLRNEWSGSPRKSVARIEAALKYPVFVKPANL